MPTRRLPIGAEVLAGGVSFRVFATGKRAIELVLDPYGASPQRVPLEPDGEAHWHAWVPGARAGARYLFRLDGDDALVPDPCSRFQPEGPHRASEVVDPRRFAWTDHGWRGRTLREAVIYELHVGTFTREGTWRAAAAHLPELARTGITVIEVMPVAEFAGAFGWGYDGVSLFAPYHRYGTPDDLRRFVDRAHSLGIAVLLDVVYNHLGPDGNYFPRFSDRFWSDRYETDWGASPRFDGEGAEPVREIFVANARYWIEEHHFDGLRIDATQDTYDFGGGEHILAAVTRAVREAAPDRSTLVIAENEPQQIELVRPRSAGGAGMDAIWNDDFHHSAAVALTGRNEAYYCDYRGSAQELAAAARHGFLYQGQRYAWQSLRRGTPALGEPPETFIAFLENHDQVANSIDGRRLHQLASPAKYRALVTLLLLGPATPMLFQGEEFMASAPFLYFADHHAGLAPLVAKGRREYLAQFPSIGRAEVALDDPADPLTFERSKLDDEERRSHRAHRAMIEALLAIRRDDRAISGAANQGKRWVDAATLSERDVLIVRWLSPVDDDARLLVVNLGPTRHLASCSEPLSAPPLGRRWRDVFVSEDPAWGGRGAPPLEQDDGWHLTAECAVLLSPEPDPVPRFGPPARKRRGDEAR